MLSHILSLFFLMVYIRFDVMAQFRKYIYQANEIYVYLYKSDNK